MSRQLIALAVVLAPAVAWADDPPPAPAPASAPASAPVTAPPVDTAPPGGTGDTFGEAEKVDAPAAAATAPPAAAASDEAREAGEPVENDDHGVHDRELGPRVGMVIGSHLTPGGLRVGGNLLYQLDDQLWFDGAMLFTFGGGGAGCFRDRENAVVCEHDRLDGLAGELALAIRYVLPESRGGLRPYARAGAAVRVVRYADDDVTGLAFPLLAGAGARMRVAPWVAVGLEAQLELGFGVFSRGIGLAPQAGLGLTATVEIALP